MSVAGGAGFDQRLPEARDLLPLRIASLIRLPIRRIVAPASAPSIPGILPVGGVLPASSVLPVATVLRPLARAPLGGPSRGFIP